uniref:protein-glutamine gamma-glutamyltransferase n=2 Tax=Latimeria chalumnae TaxID=7897 RepID=H2ZTS7_LATCH
VNCDIVYWKKKKDGSGIFRPIFKEESAIGHFISTKAVGSNKREDITHLYKYPEGSEEERISVETACQHGTKPKTYLEGEKVKDVVINVQTEKNLQMGSDFTVWLRVQNCSTEQRGISLFTQVAAIYYTGVYKSCFKKKREEVQLSASEVRELELVIKYSEYDPHLESQDNMLFTVLGRVAETRQVIAKQHKFCLCTPDLQIRVLGEAIVGKEMKAEIVFINPLPKILKNVQLHIEGPGLQTPKIVTIGDVGSHAKVTHTESLVPVRPGMRTLIANLDCPQLSQVHGVAEILVKTEAH